MADEFPRAEVIGVDLAPIQPRYTSISLACSSSSRLTPLLEQSPQIARKSRVRFLVRFRF